MKEVLIPTIHLFPLLEQRLIDLLRSLTDEEWQRPTIAKQWTVKDVATHLLDGNLRALSMGRDHYFGEKPGAINSYDDLVGYLNGLNADWVKATRRLSPAVLIQLMEPTGKQYNEELALRDPFAPAMFSVSWAGEDQSVNWFHIAREYTERWHHQQQIRDAVNKPGIITKELYYPVMDTFMMALPYTYRDTPAKENTVVQVTISGSSGGDWFLIKKQNWQLQKKNHLPVTTQVSIDENIAWKLFTKSWRRKDVISNISIKGNEALAEPVLGMIAVMA